MVINERNQTEIKFPEGSSMQDDNYILARDRFYNITVDY